MPYRIHHDDKPALVDKLKEALRYIPKEETDDLIRRAEALLYNAEYGQRGRLRLANPNDAFWYEHDLIRRADQYIKVGTPALAYSNCLVERNNSGFVDQVRRVYMRPGTPHEIAVSQEIREMIIRVILAIFNDNPMTKSPGLLGDRRMDLYAIVASMQLLGDDVPAHLVTKLKDLLDKIEKEEPKDARIKDLRREMKHRYGIT